MVPNVFRARRRIPEGLVEQESMRGVGPAGAVLPIASRCTAPDGPLGRGVKPAGVKPAGGAAAMAGPASSAMGAEERITRLIYEERSNEAGALG